MLQNPCRPQLCAKDCFAPQFFLIAANMLTLDIIAFWGSHQYDVEERHYESSNVPASCYIRFYTNTIRTKTCHYINKAFGFYRLDIQVSIVFAIHIQNAKTGPIKPQIKSSLMATTTPPLSSRYPRCSSSTRPHPKGQISTPRLQSNYCGVLLHHLLCISYLTGKTCYRCLQFIFHHSFPFCSKEIISKCVYLY